MSDSIVYIKKQITTNPLITSEIDKDILEISTSSFVNINLDVSDKIDNFTTTFKNKKFFKDHKIVIDLTKYIKNNINTIYYRFNFPTLPNYKINTYYIDSIDISHIITGHQTHDLHISKISDNLLNILAILSKNNILQKIDKKNIMYILNDIKEETTKAEIIKHAHNTSIMIRKHAPIINQINNLVEILKTRYSIDINTLIH